MIEKEGETVMNKETITSDPHELKTLDYLSMERLNEIKNKLANFDGLGGQDVKSQTEVVRQQYARLSGGMSLSTESQRQLDLKMQNEVATLQERGLEKREQFVDLQIEKVVLENSLGVPLRQEKVSARPGIVFENSAVLSPYGSGDFIGSLYIGGAVVEGLPLCVKATRGMGRAVFIEGRTQLEGRDYNFIQWKGVDSLVGGGIEQNLAEADGSVDYIVGEKVDFSPLMMIKFPGGKESVRFRGTSFYKNLLREAEKSKQFEQYGLRMPKILKTIKFSREFCQEHNLPVPENDEEGDSNGEMLKDFVERQDVVMGDKQKEIILLSYEAKKHNKGFVLGQSIRAFRNVWRVDDAEKLRGDKEGLAQIIETSKKILSEEFGRELGDREFVEEFAKLLGQQVAILLENRLVQGAMRDHKQDITFAAEICDFDGAYNVDEYLADPNNEPQWLKDGQGTREDWIKERELKLYRQILLVGAHLKPIIGTMEELGRGDFSEEVISQFIDGIASNLSEEKKKQLEQFLVENQNKIETEYDKKMQNIEDIVGDSEVARRNFAGYKLYFEDICAKLLQSIQGKK
ncbi:MAG: hypothetical protein Q7S57_02100 [bacterium]|nr:hypothetical protein [bacterium]